MFILLPFCAPASSSDKTSKSLLWSDHIGCLHFSRFHARLELSFLLFFLGGISFSAYLTPFVTWAALYNLSLTTALLHLPHFSFLSVFMFLPVLLPSVHLSDLSNIYISPIARNKYVKHKPLYYSIQLYHKQKREYISSAGGGPLLSRSILNGTDNILLTQIRDIMLWQVYLNKLISPR